MGRANVKGPPASRAGLYVQAMELVRRLNDGTADALEVEAFKARGPDATRAWNAAKEGVNWRRV